jgi:hypothetical protein
VPSPDFERRQWVEYCVPSVAGQWADGYTVTLTFRWEWTIEEVEFLNRFHLGISSGPDAYDMTARWGSFHVECLDAAGGLVREWFPTRPLGGPQDPRALRDVVAARVRPLPPSIGSAPPEVAVVNLPTWLWVNDAWEPMRDGASGAFMTIDVEARPVRVVWRFDDDGAQEPGGSYRADGGAGEASCDGPGVVWRRGMPEGATDCSYTFTYPSAWERSGRFAMSATVTWEFRWWLDGVDQGVFGSVEPVSTREIEVIEIQTVGTRG